MFLQSLLRSNSEFVSAAIELHQAGRIPANSYVLDIDAIGENARQIVNVARKYGLAVFPMTKQFGRNPKALAAIAAAGVERFVAVDMACARAIRNGGFGVGNLGHLVQVPRHEIDEALAMKPAYWTVFSHEQAAAVSRSNNDARQKLLIRIYNDDDVVVPTSRGRLQFAND